MFAAKTYFVFQQNVFLLSHGQYPWPNIQKSYIRHEDFRPFGLCPWRSGDPSLGSEMGWTGELWSKTNLLNWQNKEKSIFFGQKIYIYIYKYGFFFLQIFGFLLDTFICLLHPSTKWTWFCEDNKWGLVQLILTK